MIISNPRGARLRFIYILRFIPTSRQSLVLLVDGWLAAGIRQAIKIQIKYTQIQPKHETDK